MAQDDLDLSERRPCRLLQLHRSTCRYEAKARDDARLRRRLRELAGEYRRWGVGLLTDVLRREGFTDNHKRIWRVYAEEKLQVRKRRRGRKRYVATNRVKHPVELPDDRWGMDFVHDGFLDGRKFRALTIVDHCTRECLAGRSACRSAEPESCRSWRSLRTKAGSRVRSSSTTSRSSEAGS